MTSFDFTNTGKIIRPRREVDVQKECWDWLSRFILDGGKCLQDYVYMVPNGTQLSGTNRGRAKYMASLKAQGLRPGVSDIVIAFPVWRDKPYQDGPICYHGAYIELKKEKELYSGPAAVRSAIRNEQKDWLELMRGVGYWVAVAYGTADFQSLVRSYLAKETQPSLPWKTE